eukprot:m.169641 g.169641  ORF g.169641 m.169641 type:complete len:132 (+) comp39007_c0_seq4:23-418(+)
MPAYKLTYFDSRGRAEIIRLIFAQGGIDFEDIRFDYGSENWTKLKPSAECVCYCDKQSCYIYILAGTPFGQLPILEIDGKVLAQTIAIAVYAAEVTGLHGETPLEKAQVHMVFEGPLDSIFSCSCGYLTKP